MDERGSCKVVVEEDKMEEKMVHTIMTYDTSLINGIGSST